MNGARVHETPIRFNLAVADKAPRTTGAKKTVAGLDESKVDFQAFHDADRPHARKRLYMTATPRVYHGRSRAAAEKRDYVSGVRIASPLSLCRGFRFTPRVCRATPLHSSCLLVEGQAVIRHVDPLGVHQVTADSG